MAHKIYDNFYLSNEIEDQFNSHLDLQQFCTVDNSLVGTAAVSTDTTVTAGKTYYAKSGLGYVAVVPAEGDSPETKGWYEITAA